MKSVRTTQVRKSCSRSVVGGRNKARCRMLRRNTAWSNRTHIDQADDETLAQQKTETQWLCRIEYCLDNDCFYLYFQLIPSLQVPQGLHYELLLRLPLADGNLFAPGAFMPAAERYGLATNIDRWVIDFDRICGNRFYATPIFSHE